jgi:hypothetical protein
MSRFVSARWFLITAAAVTSSLPPPAAAAGPEAARLGEVALAALGADPQPGDSAPTGDGNFELETFPNTWHISTIGLAFDSGLGTMYYFHEGQTADPETIWEVVVAPPHTPVRALDLSALNAGFPVTLNDRDGGAFDPALATFLIADFNGDLTNRDDNIVEIDRNGNILNAWELDGAGNDSSDGSAIPTVIDVTVVPGSPNRYFATAADASGLIREIQLVRQGEWVDDSWSTVGTCEVAGAGDIVGTDWDPDLGVLYAVSFNNADVWVVDLDCNVLASYTCGTGVHTGVAFAADSYPRQVWVTDFTSNATTRCQVVLFEDNFETGDTARWSSTVP